MLENKILYGDLVSNKILVDLKVQIQKLLPNKIKIVFIQVGDNIASKSYILKKKNISNQLGILSQIINLPLNTNVLFLKKLIFKLNKDKSVNGILIQLPLPKHLNEYEIVNYVNTNKDIDGINKKNLGKIMQNNFNGLLPCTPTGIIELLKNYNIELEHKHIVIVGRSIIVGKPLSMMLLSNIKKIGNATVTVCHSKTKNIKNIIAIADILIVAVGKPKFIKKEMIKKESIIIDVGVNKDFNSNKIVGDVDFNNVIKKASKITPVPGGIGPLTIASLMKNTLKAYNLQKNLHFL